MAMDMFSKLLGLTYSVGHATKDCTNNRVFDLSAIADATAEDAWVALEKADQEKDLDDIRNVGQELVVRLLNAYAVPGYQGLQQGNSRDYLRPARTCIPYKRIQYSSHCVCT